MQKPSLPANEAARLASLADHYILDTPSEQVFDNITTLAAKICDTPYAFIALIDSRRQWFKSTYGMELQESDREESFCGHAILGEDIMEVPDASQDPRFHDNPFVEGDFQARFYAGKPIQSAEGQALGTLCVMDRKPRQLAPEQMEAINALAQLVETLLSTRRQQAKFAWLGSVLDAMSEEVALFDMDSLHYVYANDSALDELDIDIDALKETTPLDMMPELDREALEALLRPLRQGEKEVVISEQLRRRKGGLLYPVEIRIQIIRTAVPVFASVVRDISERKAIERAQRELISTVSHELRTPLGSIDGALSVITSGMAGPVPEPVAEMASLAQRNSQRLVRLVTEFLDLEKAELGKVDFRIKPLHLDDVLNEALTTNQGFAHKHGVRLQLGEAPQEAVLADPDRLQQVLTNLLSNAIKFSPPDGIVTIEAHRLEKSHDSDSRARISIIDRGPGIPEEFKPYLFEKFSQAQNSDKKRPGTGLGLALVKAYVEGMHGRVDFDSQPHEGTAFHVDLPMTALG
ncbi:GAF domain-containing sensor histidine kinase [Halomonas daqiaonensis]|uniref:histidine kinase n=1 Tax=Halomonas daqiaonensis TaxID=650850 RepID=A0A1H7H2X8_9GAMM|nr:GAF domain-containing sensor histidine kinase [Halomonas daqiaonensis]SEK44743.1 PAS domain S-box-containing protein [Halomonas daqiaonensis]